MHHIYTTPAFVVHSSPQGEASKFIILFTRDFGMIGAVAQGIRLSGSKLRYHIQDGDYSNISIVRGKEVWRVTGAYALERKTETGGKITDTGNKKLFVRILTLLKRLLHGEEKNENLFEVVKGLYEFLILNTEEKEAIEYVTVLRILHCLGYISNKKELEDLVLNSILDEEVFIKAKEMKKKIIKEINEGLRESQL